ncbi:hypothetical protein Tco_0754725, partial [Tanacetum coccineum]
KGVTKETVHVEYEWNPPRYEQCKIFGHMNDQYPKNATTIPNVMNNDGFQMVVKEKKSGKIGYIVVKTTCQLVNQKAPNVPLSSFYRGFAKNRNRQYLSSASNIHTSNPIMLWMIWRVMKKLRLLMMKLLICYSSERPLHSSSHSARPFRKRCRSPVDSVPLSTLFIGLLAPTSADLLPPRKRFKDSYSSEASIEEDAEVGPIKIDVDMEFGIGDGDDVRDHVEIDPRDVRDDTEEYEADTNAGDTVEVGVDPMSLPIVEEEIVEPAREDSSDSSGTRDGIVRSFEDMPIDLDDVVHDFYHHMSDVRIDRIVGIKTA